MVSFHELIKWLGEIRFGSMNVARHEARLVYGEGVDWVPDGAYIFEWYSDDETLMWGWCDCVEDLSGFIREKKSKDVAFSIWRLRDCV